MATHDLSIAGCTAKAMDEVGRISVNIEEINKSCNRSERDASSHPARTSPNAGSAAFRCRPGARSVAGWCRGRHGNTEALSSPPPLAGGGEGEGSARVRARRRKAQARGSACISRFRCTGGQNTHPSQTSEWSKSDAWYPAGKSVQDGQRISGLIPALIDHDPCSSASWRAPKGRGHPGPLAPAPWMATLRSP